MSVKHCGSERICSALSMILAAPVSCKASRLGWVNRARGLRHKGRTNTRLGASASLLEPIFGRCQSGKIKKRLLLAISLSRPYCGFTPISRIHL